MESKHYVLKRCGAAKWLARQATAETVVPRFVSIASSHPWKGSGLRGTLLLMPLVEIVKKMFSSVELEAQFSYMPCCRAGPFSVDSGSGLWLRLRRQVQKGQFECCCFFRRLLNMGTFFSLDLSNIAQGKGKEFI